MAEQHDFHVSVTGVPTLKHVLGFNAVDAVSRPFEGWLDILTSDALDDDAIIGATVGIHFGHAAEDPHTVAGVIESLTAFALPDAEGGRLFNYRLNLVHPLALLAWYENCRIFQELSAPDIIKKVLADSNITGKGIDFRLTGSYLKREYCVQYNESIFAFVSRLCEAEGIYYFFEYKPDSDDFTLVFADDSTAAKPVDGEAELRFVEANGLDFIGDSITTLSARERVVSGKFTLRDYNLETPKVDLTADAKAKKYDDLEVYDYPGGYPTVAEGKRLAKARLEAAAVEQQQVDFETNTARLTAARTLKIVDAEDPDVKGEYFLTSVTHRWERTGASTGGAAAIGGQQYRCSTTVIPKASKYRPPIVTPVPVIDGAQTATVVCPAGAPLEEIHTDKYGRAKLKFHWDKDPAMDDKASAWFRVGQVQTSGSQALPRLNWEVIVEFLEGDPDRPIVTGRLYNGMFMPPYALPGGKSRTSIGSSTSPGGEGRNEIRLEDKAGAEEIAVSSKHNTSLKAANNKSTDVGNNESKTVTGNVKVTIGANEDVKITKGCENGIKGNQSLSVGALRKLEVNAVTALTVGGNATTSVGAAQMEYNGNPLEALIALATAKAAEAAAAKAAEVMDAVKGAVQDKINQVMGPVDALVGKAQAIGEGMQAVASGNLGAAAGVFAGAAGVNVPSFGGGGGGGEGGGGGGGHDGVSAEPAATTETGGAPSAGAIAASNALSAAITGAVQKGIRKGAKAINDAAGGAGEGGGGGSADNTKGQKGDVAGVDATDRDKGPGHSLSTVDGSITETVGAAKVLAVADVINVNCASMTETIGAARAEIVVGNRVESVEGMKSETTIGLVIVSRADETEKVGGMKTCMVGGAIAEKIGGGHSIEAGSMATFISAFHKVEAAGKLTFKCGASEIVVDDGGITITSPLVAFLASKLQLTKAATEV